MLTTPTTPTTTPPPPKAAASSRLPYPTEVVHVVARAAMTFLCCVACLFLALFALLCVLLARANTPEVRAACPGFWDFMLAAVFAPVAIPALYCAVACCLWVAWRPFYAGCSAVMAVACLHSALTAGENAACIEALRATSAPLPWLLYACYVKCALFTGGAVSGFSAGAGAGGATAAADSEHKHHPHFFI